MNLIELEKILEFKILETPNIFKNNISQVTGVFNPEAILPFSADPIYQRFSKNRLNEFYAGRICAIKALNQFIPFSEIMPIGINKLPVWPKGFTGSITHSRDIVSAAISPSEENQGIGLDLEFFFDKQTAHDLEKDILLPPEKIFLNNNHYQDIVTLIYSAKESIYKAINALNSIFLNFQDIEIISINFELNQFDARVKFMENKIFRGNFLFGHSFVSTSVEI